MAFRDKRRKPDEEESSPADVDRRPMFAYLILAQPRVELGEERAVTLGIAHDPEEAIAGAAPQYPEDMVTAKLLHRATTEELTHVMLVLQAQQVLGQALNAGRRVQPVAGHVQ